MAPESNIAHSWMLCWLRLIVESSVIDGMTFSKPGGAAIGIVVSNPGGGLTGIVGVSDGGAIVGEWVGFNE